MRRKSVAGVVCALAVALVLGNFEAAQAGEQSSVSGYRVLDPIRHDSLMVFPVVAPKSFSTGEFLTLDEGLRSGEVVVTEYGNVRGLIRRPRTRPLLLLAGEIVAGGKQDRVIGKDRIVPPESDPVDLGVFCVEPGRWVGTSEHFGASGAIYNAGKTGEASGVAPAL